MRRESGCSGATQEDEHDLLRRGAFVQDRKLTSRDEERREVVGNRINSREELAQRRIRPRGELKDLSPLSSRGWEGGCTS